jgi:hypothetical protein
VSSDSVMISRRCPGGKGVGSIAASEMSQGAEQGAVRDVGGPGGACAGL